jgi:hypothetical protein
MEEMKNTAPEIVEEDNLEQAAGGEGDCWNSARFVAPDGHDVGCSMVYYRVQFSDRDFIKKFPTVCPVDGGPHDPSGRKYCGDGKYLIICKKCGHYVDKDGKFYPGWGILAD